MKDWLVSRERTHRVPWSKKQNDEKLQWLSAPEVVK